MWLLFAVRMMVRGSELIYSDLRFMWVIVELKKRSMPTMMTRSFGGGWLTE